MIPATKIFEISRKRDKNMTLIYISNLGLTDCAFLEPHFLTYFYLPLENSNSYQTFHLKPFKS